MNPFALPRLRALLACAATALLLSGCASTGNPRDPFEPVNRGIYKFNDHADHLLIKPAAELYRDVVPAFVRTGISNFFSNINDVIIALNNLLQGKVTQAATDVSRIVVNTTVGLLGTLDVATEIGLEKHNEDFGQTLGKWGFGSGPYLVLPFLGPSSVRDGIGLLGDWKTDPMTYVDPVRSRNQLYGVFFLSRRAELLDASRILDTAALDPYEFLRDAYLQRRRNLVHDGNPPEEDENGAPAKSARPGTPSAGAGNPAQPEAAVAPVQAASTTEPAAAPQPPKRVVRVWLPGTRN